MKKVNQKDKLFYFERNFFTLDGLWMIETENEINWETALKIDLAVWKKLIKIIIRRIKKYLKIETNTLTDLVEILTFRWSIEGWEYNTVKNEENEVLIEIHRCPYKSTMDRNPDRHDKIPLICRNMCIPFYKEAAHDFNSKISLERNKSMGLGNDLCDFHFKLEEK
ncbi:MAG: hypothetical protein EU540_02125 [Promethearchaeota archaeon]|nr:MAG: hypothetical protein EU540_02125 [Candidatus Lokiarchaeota archaeon]